jgi:hypothetical protein
LQIAFCIPVFKYFLLLCAVWQAALAITILVL